MKLVAQTQLQIMSFSIISIQMKMMYNSYFHLFVLPSLSGRVGDGLLFILGFLSVYPCYSACG